MLHNIFFLVETISSEFLSEYKVQKNIIYFKIIFVSLFMNVFTVTFDQFNASLLNKSIDFKKQGSLTPNFLMVSVSSQCCSNTFVLV